MLSLPTLSQILSSLFANTWRVTPWWSRDEQVAVERSVLRILRVAHHEQIDLAPLVESLALEHRRIPRYRLRKLVKRLRSGTALIDALEQTPGIVSDDNVLRLRFASQSGTLSKSWDAMIAEDMQVTTNMRFQLKQTLIYQGILLGLILLFASALNAFVVPTFIKLWQEMGLEPSSSVRLSNEMVTALFNNFGTLFWIALIVAIGSRFFKPVRFFRQSVSSKWFSSVASIRVAKLLRMLSQSADAGRPLSGSLSALAKYHYDMNFRSKLLFARNEVEQGVDPWDSLASSEILTTHEAKALREASTPSIRSWMMLKFANAKEENVLQRAEVLVSLIHPLVTLLFGLFVLWIGTICFGSISQLISSLS